MGRNQSGTVEGALHFITKKYTPAKLAGKIKAYFNGCDNGTVQIRINGFKGPRKRPYTVEHLGLYLGLSSHEIHCYTHDEGFKEFHTIMECARQKIIGDWISKGLTGEYNATFLKFLLPHISLYNEFSNEDIEIGSQELKTITVFDDETKPLELEDKGDGYVDAELKE